MSKTFLEALTSVGKNLQSEIDKLNEKKVDYYFITPEQFGAKGDGTTDDTNAIQSAIDYAAEQTHKPSVLFSPKTYKTTSPLTLQNNVNLVSHSKVTEYHSATVIYNETSDLISLTSDVGFLCISGIEFRGGGYYGAQTSLFSGTGNLKYSKITDCAFTALYTVFNSITLIGCTLKDIMIDSVVNGGKILGSDNYIDTWFFALSKQNTTYDNTYMLIISCRLTDIKGIYFTGCQPATPELGTNRILQLLNANACTILNCRFTYSKQSCLDIFSSRNIIIQNNEFAGWGYDMNQTNCIVLQNTTGCQFSRNNFDKADAWDINTYNILTCVGTVSATFKDNNYYTRPTFNNFSTTGKEIFIDEPQFGIYKKSILEVTIDSSTITYEGNGNNILQVTGTTLNTITTDCSQITCFFLSECTCNNNVILKNGRTTATGHTTFIKRSDGKFYEL